MFPRLAALLLAIQPLWAGTAADLARAIRETSFDPEECYRVRDLKISHEDIRIYLTDGHLIFSRPVAGRRIAALFAADVDGGDGEVLLLPPNQAERRSLASYIGAPNLDEHIRTAIFLFTGDDYAQIQAHLPGNPTNKRSPEAGALLAENWTPTLRNLAGSYETRLALDLLNGPPKAGLFAGILDGVKLGRFDLIFDPARTEQILAGQIATRDDRLYFDTWASFPARSSRPGSNGAAPGPEGAAPPKPDLAMRDYRIQATVTPDLVLSATAHVTVTPSVEGLKAADFDISPEMAVDKVTVDGRDAEVLQRDTLRLNLTRGGDEMFLVLPSEPLRAGRGYDFAFHYSGKVIHDAGDRVFYVSARGSWYPTHGLDFASFDLQFRYPADLELVTPGDVVEDRTEGDSRITRRRTPTPIRIAGFNLGAYDHARVQRGPYTVDVCANRAIEEALRQQPQAPPPLPPPPGARRRRTDPMATLTEPPTPAPTPQQRLQDLASQVASALEFMAQKFGPPALPHLTVSPIPGTFGQGFPGLIYLSTLSYLKTLPRMPATDREPEELFFEDVLQAHETAHQWWGNRVTVPSYRDAWLMESLANYSALLYLEKTKGPHILDVMLDSYRTSLLEKGATGQTVESAGPIVLGGRLATSIEPRAWRAIIYGKGSWIMQMLRARMGEDRFLAMLAEVLRRYDHREISTEQFRAIAAQFLPPKSDDPKLETFFDQWVYGTGIPTLKLTYSIKGKAPALRLVGTLSQSDVDDNFETLAPVEIQLSRTRTITQWVRASSTPVPFSIPLRQAPLKVTLDPHRAVLRR